MSTNKFKIGDRVRAYDKREGVITEMHESGRSTISLGDSNYCNYNNSDLTLIEPEKKEDKYISTDEAKYGEGYEEASEAEKDKMEKDYWGNIKQSSTKKGFDPETLTFDGVKIEEGDKVEISFIKDNQKVREDAGRVLSLDWGIETISLKFFNITAHHPKAKSELEEAEEELEEAHKQLITGSRYAKEEEFRDLDRYYQARKKVEGLEKK